MGSSGSWLSQWSKGEYAYANNQQDDLAVITRSGNEVSYRPDDHGDSPAEATELLAEPLDDTLVQFTAEGIIETREDRDWFELDLTDDGLLRLVAAPWFYRDGRNNLDLQADLYDATGRLLQSANPGELTHASIELNLKAGTYYVAIDGVGKGDPLGTGYTDYGSLGQYEIYADFGERNGDNDGHGPGTVVIDFEEAPLGQTALVHEDPSGFTFRSLPGNGTALEPLKCLGRRTGSRPR